ncbi:MAG: sulfotransferase [Thermodesulfobacteriota bacterium]|nr:sulfotransferase [Thermodesulfobacteriota bacterium]
MIRTSSHKESHHLPNLIVIGAMKCATTSLHYYLGLHPEIFMSQEKELNFFIREGNWHKGLKWYRSNFVGDAKIYGESSPNYANYPFSQGVPERIHTLVPEAKLIYIVRDPIDRIISHYVHQYAVGREHRPLSEALAGLDDNPYLCRSKYAMQLEQYFEYVPEGHVLMIAQEELYRQREETLKRVFRFLEVDDSFHCEAFSHIKHASRGKRRRRPGATSLEYLSEDILERLPPSTGQNLGHLLHLSFSHKIERPVLEEHVKQGLIDALEDDVHRFRQWTGLHFESWQDL